MLRVEQLLLLCYYSPFSLRCVLWLPANGIPGNRAEEILFVGALEERSAAEMAAPSCVMVAAEAALTCLDVGLLTHVADC